MKQTEHRRVAAAVGKGQGFLPRDAGYQPKGCPKEGQGFGAKVIDVFGIKKIQRREVLGAVSRCIRRLQIQKTPGREQGEQRGDNRLSIKQMLKDVAQNDEVERPSVTGDGRRVVQR